MTARFAILCFVPIILTIVVLLLLPLLLIFAESARTFIPGRIGSVAGAPLTVENYTELLAPAYLFFFTKTYWLAFVSAVVSVLIGYPIAYYIGRGTRPGYQNFLLSLLIVMMFLSALVRVYSLELTLGSVGILRPVLLPLGVDMNSRTYLEVLVVLGLLHFTVPLSALTLIGTIQNVNPRLAEAAQSLGASRMQAHLTVTVPLSIQGVLSAFLIAFTVGVSAFVIPWILGKGRVLFISNLIYSRFSEIANYPSGAAIAVTMLILSLAVVYGISSAMKKIQ